ncbi:NAD(P)/FAD-dependent oxidoreductase [Deinococcus cellulosilyticus]|uniref:FAD/NAD(P)-binding domain-containing protein n=1 Tax=Deinococcus cellulosilyticus (strain DSM 18568 / NBRC 106333 / KACC 11606 / 5516J-15) TaxID=1223518 RepID=A0A511MZR8_DEIC1|nr:FAD-dependent oxidoreductase [Deinococcus cellulosilyticus]GEM46110.1 hypothetical protein DC3_17450 [Deinococcus cellulosilyticus NBRC 106333 = KACC 11606]
MTDPQLWDTLIIGGGPAGLAAALHLAFHHRSVLVVDRGSGPLHHIRTPIFNLPGFTGKSGQEILQGLEQEALKAGARLTRDSIEQIEGSAGHFILKGKEHTYHARTLLIATGITRHHPLIDGDYRTWLPYAGKGNTFYCPDCEAPALLGKHVVVIESVKLKAALSTAKRIMEFAATVRVLLTDGADAAHPETYLDDSCEVIQGNITAVEGENGVVEALVLESGTRITADAYYVSNRKLPRNQLVQTLGGDLDERGHPRTGPRGQLIRQDGGEEDYIEGIWVAGDLLPQTQQTTIAMGSGNKSAVMIDQYLTQQHIRQLGKAQDADNALKT